VARNAEAPEQTLHSQRVTLQDSLPLVVLSPLKPALGQSVAACLLHLVPDGTAPVVTSPSQRVVALVLAPPAP
jgi:hypothetical protein